MSHRLLRLSGGLFAALLVGCGAAPGAARDTGLDELLLTSLGPQLILPGTTVVLEGQGFVDGDLGVSRLSFEGFLQQTPVRLSLPTRYLSDKRLEVAVDEEFIAAVGGHLDGMMYGKASVEVRSTVDAQLHHSSTIDVDVDLASQSTPSLDLVGDGLSWVNQPIQIIGAGMLLGGAEGTSAVRLTGCFTPTGKTTCNASVDLTLPAAPESELDRHRARFPYATSISGIGPGHFAGMLTLVNHHKGGLELSSAQRPVSFDIQRPIITGASTTAASLGQFVEILGGGFVGGQGSVAESTVLQLLGTYTDKAGKQTVLDLVLVPEFVSGPRLRYVLDESDALGRSIDLRRSSGTITATVRATVQKGIEKLDGDPIAVSLQIRPVKQVLYVHFLSSYLSSLRLFGLRAADALVRARVLALSAQLFAGVNVEVRDQAPTDFALFATVDVAGPDPNGKGYFGYDNTPGKDVDNLRLYDHVGGVNAVTQADGYAGYGGVFTESFFAFSEHPNQLASAAETNELFDRLFDPFRPDVGGTELTVPELITLAPRELSSGDDCPAQSGDRAMQVSCAVWTLGNLIASTMVHEVGHSLGLADPHGSPKTFHNPGDLPNRLMETGEARPFTERALLGDGPAQFCRDEYTYLREILGSDEPATLFERQPCD